MTRGLVTAWSALLLSTALALVGPVVPAGVAGSMRGHDVTGGDALDGVQVGLIVAEAAVEDDRWLWDAYQGLLRAGSDLGVGTMLYASRDPGEFDAKVQQCADDGSDLCISVGFPLSQATLTAAQANPQTDFAIIDFEWDQYPANLRGVVFAEDEAGYLVGTLAGLMTQTNIVGVVGAIAGVPAVERFVDGYRNGALCANANADVLVEYAGSFGDPTLGGQIAQEMIARGADVIFAAAGATGEGSVLGAAQAGVWAIGSDVDCYYTVFDGGAVAGSDKLLSSALKRIDNAVYDTISDVVELTFSPGTVLYDLALDGVGLASFHEAGSFVPQSVHDELARVKQGIVADTIDVSETCRWPIFLPLIMRGYPPYWCDPYEPNDGCDRAYGPLASGLSYEAYLCVGDFSDWYYIDLQSVNRITVDLNVPAVADYDVYIYQAGDCERFVAESDLPGNGRPEHIEYIPSQTGRYYVRVHPYSGDTDTLPYALMVRYD